MNTGRQQIEESEMFLAFVEVGNSCWAHVESWDWFKKSTVGKQLCTAVDSIGANIAEGAGRYGQAEALHFFIIARGSARESEYWLNRCKDRNLIPAEDVDNLLASLRKGARLLNAFITYRRNAAGKLVKEERSSYSTAPDPQDSTLSAQDSAVWQDSGLRTQDSAVWQDSALSTQDIFNDYDATEQGALADTEDQPRP